MHLSIRRSQNGPPAPRTSVSKLDFVGAADIDVKVVPHVDNSSSSKHEQTSYKKIQNIQMKKQYLELYHRSSRTVQANRSHGNDATIWVPVSEKHNYVSKKLVVKEVAQQGTIPYSASSSARQTTLNETAGRKESSLQESSHSSVFENVGSLMPEPIVLMLGNLLMVGTCPRNLPQLLMLVLR
ncbi:hypothetical protein AgCh_019676 [Apium graveolens]